MTALPYHEHLAIERAEREEALRRAPEPTDADGEFLMLAEFKDVWVRIYGYSTFDGYDICGVYLLDSAQDLSQWLTSKEMHQLELECDDKLLSCDARLRDAHEDRKQQERADMRAGY